LKPGHGTLADEKTGAVLGLPQPAPVFDSPSISVVQRKEKSVNTRKIFTLLVLVALLVAALVACGTSGSSNVKADPCPDVVCVLARILDTNRDSSVSLTESLGAGNP